ncbi:leucine aminopeptidase 3, chloroplastic-like [Apium graveolens]|uniref:leucine aminopeptidase 3, chloroplastic-like n=1 Tax=Apium graveolens TaxID=4045 RepID=UPI003D78B553
MEESYWESMKYGIADMVNTGGRQGGSITAALFLKQSVLKGLFHIEKEQECILHYHLHWLSQGAGGIIAGATSCITTPLDTIKTQL